MLTEKDPASQDIETGHNQDPTHPRPKPAKKGRKKSGVKDPAVKQQTVNPVNEPPYETGHNQDPTHPRPKRAPRAPG